MSAVISEYLSLSNEQRACPQAAQALSRVFQALSQGQEPTVEQRRTLVASLLSSAASLPEPLASDPNYLVVLASTVKFLGRSPAGTEELAREPGLRTLLQLGGVERLAALPRKDRLPVGPDVERTQNDDEDEDEEEDAAANRAFDQREEDPLRPFEAEALRCLCNVLMLHPSAREVFPNVVLSDEKRVALKGLVRVLGCDGAGFLAGRLLFMLTSKPSEAVAELVLEESVIDTLGDYANRYLLVTKSKTLGPRLSTGSVPRSEDVLREHLKLSYSLMLQYSRSSQYNRRGSRTDSLEKKKRRFWPSKQSSATETSSHSEPNLNEDSDVPLIERRDSATKSKNPLSLAKRVVGAVKSTPHSPSATSRARSPSPSSASPSINSSRRPSTAPGQDGVSPDTLTLTSAHLFLPIFRPYLALAVTTPFIAPGSCAKEPNPTVRSALNALLNFPIELEELDGSDYSWIQYLPPRTDSEGIVLRAGGIGSLGERLLELLSSTCDAYFPVDSVPPNPSFVSSTYPEKPQTLPANPDDWIATGEGEANKLEEILGPAMLLLRKLSMVGEANETFRFILFPPDLDRSKPINRHPTLTGHLVRLLSSVFLPNTAFGVGEFLYNLADRSPERLCALVGYGTASGFLQNRGELIPPPPAAAAAEPVDDNDNDEVTTAEGSATRPRPINPITGAYEPVQDPDDVPMTEEDKEREAEKLYTLFSRMERTGIMSTPENPVDQARRQGKFEPSRAEREAELEALRREDDEVERAVEKEMKDWRAKRAKAKVEE